MHEHNLTFEKFDMKLATACDKYQSWIEIQENNGSEIVNLRKTMQKNQLDMESHVTKNFNQIKS